MALNFSKTGRPIARVEGGKYDKKVLSIWTEFEEDDSMKRFNRIKIDGKFQQIPDPDKEREILYITGCSGSGKSTYSCKYIQQYKKTHKDNPIYLFSALTEDESLEPVKPNRIIIDERMITEPLTCKDFENSLVIFDDIDVIGNQKLREAVYTLLNQILETGRHFKISCIITNHLPTAGKDTKRALNECSSITYFPHSGSGRGLKYLLTEYLGLDKKTMSKIKNSKSRWATIFKNYPMVAMTEKEVFLVADEDED
jgi:hypothetical protein